MGGERTRERSYPRSTRGQSQPRVGLEEGALVRVENGRATALGRRIKLFREGVAPRWYTGRPLP